MTETSLPQTSAPCDMRLDFSSEPEVSKWRPVLDGVMGGRSTGVRFSDNDHMTFKGIINTNDGGFSSLRRQMTPGTMTGATRLKLRLRQDGRNYKLIFRTNERFRGRRVSYQLPIPQTPLGIWTDISIPLSNFRTSVFGRAVPAAQFDPAQVQEIGFIIADGVDGPFQFDVGAISCD